MTPARVASGNAEAAQPRRAVGAGGRANETTYSPEVGERIAALFGDGRTLREICREGWAPKNRQLIYSWEDAHADFAKLMAAARRHRGDAIIDDLPEKMAAEPDAQMRKILADTTIRLAGSFNRRFGPKMDMDVEVHQKVSIRAALDAGAARLADYGRTIEHRVNEGVSDASGPIVELMTGDDGWLEA